MLLWNSFDFRGSSSSLLLLALMGSATQLAAQTLPAPNAPDLATRANVLPSVTVESTDRRVRSAERPVAQRQAVPRTPRRRYPVNAGAPVSRAAPELIGAAPTAPAAVSTTIFPSRAIEATPFTPGDGIAQSAPNVSWIPSSPATQFYSIRGVGAVGSPQNFNDGMVGFNVDGFPSSLISASSALLDVRSIEVLRGPQGTRGGANAVAGSIDVQTNQPDGRREVRLTTEFGSKGYGMGEAVVGGNIVPGVLDGRMALRYARQDGDVKSLFTGDLGTREINAFRGGLNFTGSDATSVTLTGSYLKDDGNAPFYVLRNTSNFPVSGSPTEPSNKFDQSAMTLKIEHDFELFKFTSLTGFQQNRSDINSNSADKLVYDAIRFPFISTPGRTNDHERRLSEEIRLNSLEGSPIRWVVGASVIQSAYSRSCISFSCLPFGTTIATIRGTNSAVFGEATVPVGHNWEITAGGRLNYDEIGQTFSNSLGLPNLSGKSSNSDVSPTGRVAVAYKWTDEVRMYVSIARGHGNRIFSTLPSATNGTIPDAFPAATSWTYEAGVKAETVDRRLSLQASVFHNNVKNGLLAYLDPTALAFRQTYQDYETNGFELQARADITREFSVIGGVGYTHSSLGRSGVALLAVAGNRVPNVPEWTVNASAQYETPLSKLRDSGWVAASLQYSYTGARAADVDNSFHLKAYHIVNARVGWKNDARDFEVYAFGRNLLDERYETFGALLFGVQTVNVAPGRIFGIGLSKQM